MTRTRRVPRAHSGLCSEVLVRPSAAGCTLAPTLLRTFWGTPCASQRWTWNSVADMRARVWRAFAERWRTLAEGWEELPQHAILVSLSPRFFSFSQWVC